MFARGQAMGGVSLLESKGARSYNRSPIFLLDRFEFEFDVWVYDLIWFG